MTVLRGLGAILCGILLTAVGLAAPASAILPPVDGYYTFNQDGLPQARWTMQSICIQPNGTRAQADYTDETIQTLGCDVVLGSSTPGLVTREQEVVNFSGRAKLTGNLWTIQVTQPEGVAMRGRQLRPEHRDLCVHRTRPERAAQPDGHPHVDSRRGVRAGAGHDEGALHADLHRRAGSGRDQSLPGTVQLPGGRPSICS